MTDQANPGLEKIEGIFKDLFWDSLSQGATAALFIQAPYLAVWPLRPVVNYVVTRMTDKIFGMLKLQVDLQAIRFVNEEHQKEFARAMSTLAILAHLGGVESEAFLKAREDAKAELSRFVRFGAA